jgi:hypothetical protein
MKMMQILRLEAEDTVMGRIQRKRLTHHLEDGLDRTGKRQNRLTHECEADLVQKAKKQKTLAHQLEADLEPNGEKQKRLLHKSEADLDQKAKKPKTLTHQLEADLDPTGEKHRRVVHKSEADLDPSAERRKGLARQLEAGLNEVARKQRTRQARQLVEAESSGALKVQKRLHQKKLPILSDVDLNLSGGRRQRPLISLKDREEDIFQSSLVPFKTFLDQPDTETDSDIR